MTPNEVRELIEATVGKIFAARFTKRSTGETRVMLCRTGVTKYLRGGELAFDPAKKGLFIVFDMQKLAYRSVPLDPGTVLRIKGREYRIEMPAAKAA